MHCGDGGVGHITGEGPVKTASLALFLYARREHINTIQCNRHIKVKKD